VSDAVDPFIGASTDARVGAGKTFPGAATPFGLVQVSPNTITGGDNGSGYSYEHTSIEGFAFTQMSGIGWYGDLGNFLTTATTGALRMAAGSRDQKDEGYRSRYDKKTETAKAGYYAATLTDYGIRVEATAAPHAGFLRFTFPESTESRIQIDLARRVAGASRRQAVRVVDEHTIAGFMECTPEEGGWGNGSGHPRYTVYFHAQFSKPLKNWGVWTAPIPDGQPRKNNDTSSKAYFELVRRSEILRGARSAEGKHLGFFTEFETKAGEQVEMKAGISFVSEEGARKNFEADAAGKTFDQAHEAARALWDNAFAKAKVEGGTDVQKIVFYTALYHSMIDPRLFADVDGNYPGGDGKIHQTGAFKKRTIFSGWDVFRSQFPLQTLINPDVVSDTVNSLVTLAEESGKGTLERWEFLNAYSGCMLGHPAISVIADAYAKGIRSFDAEKAWSACVKTAETWPNNIKYGYAPNNLSWTLEIAYTDWCMARLAHMLGKDAATVSRYAHRAQAYTNIWDAEGIRWFRGKGADGKWQPVTANGRLDHGAFGSCESNPYQQGWFVPHAVDGLAALMGGRAAMIADLDTFFSRTPTNLLWNNYYNHSNEPVHHVPFLYNRLGAPWKTQRWTRFICDNAYKTGAGGLVGNEDVGQMSAWYVLAAGGMHPVCPGDTRMELTSPVFDRVVWQLPDGKTFTIVAKNNAPSHPYIQSATLNGKPYGQCHIDYQTVLRGGTLELALGPEPNERWGVDAPAPQTRDGDGK
jgi:predicted alpha-1,2-mannosidase